jgi:DNA glycosylase AlkZ-like
MATLTHQLIQSYRAEKFGLLPEQRLTNKEQAVEFVNQRGFIFFWPITGIPFPSLWTAAAGDRPVADAHDDPGHITWGWKDEMLGARRWYYAKVLRKRATMISLDMLPYFYAVSENYGSPEDDYLTLYEQGRLTQEAKAVYEAILDNGAMNTVALRRAVHMTSRESDHRFNRAITDLQTDFKITPIGVAQAGSWNYAFIYEITARFYPELPDLAHPISEIAAQQKLCEAYFRSMGAARLPDVKKIFSWNNLQAERAIERLARSGILKRGLAHETEGNEWIALAELA